ncbi:MAG: ribosomal-protein-alanine N-acetyltransferase [Anaerolineae bacterium]|nr:MAG: ribosomal-protein-alanine N-acetyltransferase [Anaerolineae bacterium]
MCSSPAPRSPAVHIRPMAPRDIPQVMAVDKASFAMPWPERAYRFELESNTLSICLVAEEKPKVVGMIVAWLLVDELHIATIGVHPDYRRQGIGARLLAAALLTGIRRGAHVSTLEVRVSNLPAQALYRHFGYEIVGRRPRYYKDNNEDALLMTASTLDEAFLQAVLGETTLHFS